MGKIKLNWLKRKQDESEEKLLHPAGSLNVTQHVTPLNADIDKVGAAKDNQDDDKKQTKMGKKKD